MLRLAVIGLGRRALGLVKTILEYEPSVALAGIADTQPQQVRDTLAKAKIDHSDVRFYADADALLAHADAFDGVLIGTRCVAHAPLAIKVAATGLALFLEKPVAITTEQAMALYEAYRGRENRVVVSFPLRVTPLFRAVHDIVRSGRLGTINQVQAINNVSYGGVYFGDWYRNYDEVGGLWLQKATHDLDYINHLLGRTPHSIAAVGTRGVYGGQMPFDLRCSACDQTETCKESPKHLAQRGDGGGMNTTDHWCAFSRGIRNQDAGSALLLYSDGLHASYTQNFISRRGALRRGAIITGYDATLEFDWATDTITVHDHHTHRVDRIAVKATGGHEGGDQELVRGFIQLMRGEPMQDCADLRDGLASAIQCLAARESVLTRQFQAVSLPWSPAPCPPLPTLETAGL